MDARLPAVTYVTGRQTAPGKQATASRFVARLGGDTVPSLLVGEPRDRYVARTTRDGESFEVRPAVRRPRVFDRIPEAYYVAERVLVWVVAPALTAAALLRLAWQAFHAVIR